MTSPLNNIAVAARAASRRRAETGSALVELALALPLLLLVLVITVDFSRIFYTAMSLTDAARAGAQYGAYNASNSSDTATMISTAVGATSLTGVTAQASRTCQCATDTGTFSASALSSPNDCLATESASCPVSGQHRVITVTVTALKTFTTIFGNFPGIPNSTNLVRSATLRVPQ